MTLLNVVLYDDAIPRQYLAPYGACHGQNVRTHPFYFEAGIVAIISKVLHSSGWISLHRRYPRTVLLQ
jgi:hypothetical protein